jgi:hypothetical protein
MLVVVVFADGSANGGRDAMVLECLVFNNRLVSNKGIVRKVMSPPSSALGLNSFRLASLHMLSLGLCVPCLGSPTVANILV